MKYLLTITAATMLIMSSCSKSYLDRYPLDQQTEATAFKTNGNFKTYAWGLYSIFTGYGTGGAGDPAMLSGDRYSDNMGYGAATNSNLWALQTIQVPNNDGGYSFAYIRSANILLDNVDQSSMNQTDKDHWRSVGLLFRSVRYMQLLSRFGDVPWFEHVVQDNDAEILYGPRNSRDTVAERILRDLVWAANHIKVAGDGSNTVNLNVVRAIISKFGLFEGTWRKYHGLQNANTYLQACIDYSAPLFASYSAGTTITSYDLLFNSEKLGGFPGVILYKEYATGQQMHAFSRYTMTSAWNFDLTRDAVESYLCTDGKPVKASPGYSDSTMFAEFRKRDRRLYMTVMPPYKVTVLPGNKTFSLTGNIADKEYIDTMNNIRGASTKSLPASNWNVEYLDVVPHFRGMTYGYCSSKSGFFCWKFYNKTTPTTGEDNTTDCPILRVEEVMLNYAEAKYEIGQFDQSVADQTINKLRVRANVAPMTVASIDPNFDPARDPSVNEVLWEIRRERRVELMGEGFRLDDLRRWKKANYLKEHSQLGVKIKQANYNPAHAKVIGGATEGYVKFFDEPTAVWPDYYYLYPLPKDQLTINANLKPNPGWN